MKARPGRDKSSRGRKGFRIQDSKVFLAGSLANRRFNRFARTFAGIAYHPRFPVAASVVISEADVGFGETCGMAPADIRRVILNILERIAPDEDLSNLDDARPFREQMELDSMDFLDIVMELRKQYRVQIPEADYPQLGTMDSTVAYLTPMLKDVSA